MPIDHFIISVYCCVEKLLNRALKNIKLRSRGFAPKFTDAEVITLEIVGEFLGFDNRHNVIALP